MMTKLYVNAVTLLNEFKRDERGVTAIEYGLIGVAMAVALAAILGTGEGEFLKELTDAFDGIASKLSTATGS
ncbi:Flp pilus assembly protein [Vibrio maritimus]|uniref:Flp pilus assembly protein n=1 Tax=Vibrio maritimus TaxID=990268 RepID=A0A090TT51_9VIBR|nr:Flp pilus assembly protein [Vibrio maritimus]